jgi:cyanate permease
MAIFLTLAATAAPVGAGILYDHFGSYEPMLWIIFLLALAAVCIMLFAKPEVPYQD